MLLHVFHDEIKCLLAILHRVTNLSAVFQFDLVLQDDQQRVYIKGLIINDHYSFSFVRSARLRLQNDLVQYVLGKVFELTEVLGTRRDPALYLADFKQIMFP